MTEGTSLYGSGERQGSIRSGFRPGLLYNFLKSCNNETEQIFLYNFTKDSQLKL